MIVKQCRGGHRAELQLQIDIGPVCRDGYHEKVKHHEGQGAGAGQWKVTSSQEGGHLLTPTHPDTYTHIKDIYIHTYTHTHTHTHKGMGS